MFKKESDPSFIRLYKKAPSFRLCSLQQQQREKGQLQSLHPTSNKEGTSYAVKDHRCILVKRHF